MTTTTTQRPKVELALNQQATFRLLKDKPYIGDNVHGTYYLYSVQEGTEEKAFFATAEIHQAILEANLKTDDQFSVKKVAVQNGKKITTQIEFAVVSKQNGQPTTGSNGQSGNRELM